MITKVKEDRNVVTWHKRLAHMKLPDIHNLINSHYLYGMNMVKKMKCIDCKGLKPHTRPLETGLEIATKYMECIYIRSSSHCDLGKGKVHDLFCG